MASINKVILIGNLGADPEVRFSPGGIAVANLRLATNETWKDKNGQKQERTEWHRVTLFGRLAELARDYLAKGRTVYIEGRLQTRKWQDKEGHDRYSTDIVASSMQFLGGGGGAGGRTTTGGDSGFSAPSANNDFADSPPPFDSDEDIPF